MDDKHEPAGSPKGGQFANKGNAIMNAAIRGENIIHNEVTDKRTRARMEIEMASVPKKLGAVDAQSEMISAIGDYSNKLIVGRNSKGKIVAAASYSIDGGYNMNGGEISMLHISHIGSGQAGEGMRLVKDLELIGKKQGAKGIVLESRMAAREYWAKTGFTLMGNSANRFMKKF